MMEWQPIETAPKDGTHFLGWSPDGDKYFCQQIKETWMGKYKEGSIGYQRWLDGDAVLNIGWNYIEANYILTWKPTHWMPMPEPPKVGE